jgi:hypothetical protein
LKNNYRFDLSDYLIHFFRDIDEDGTNSVAMPEHMGWHSPYDERGLPAIYMMRAALRNARLWATWSYRDGVRTVYGHAPTVCFTDMPIAAFVEASKLRHERGEAMGEVALVFPKKQIQRLGALPAIYGLSHRAKSWPDGTNGVPRIISPDILPLNEQYRFVPFYSSSEQQIDWTHEREWRWPFLGKTDPESVADWWDIPGLDFCARGVSGIGAIVKTRVQADLIVHDMLALVDAQIAQEHTFSFVLVSDELPQAQEIQNREHLSQALRAATIDIDQYFIIGRDDASEINLRFSQEVGKIERDAGIIEDGEFGACWLWLHDGTALLTRALLKSGRAFANKEGRYLVNLHEYSDLRSLRQREDMTKKLAKSIRDLFNTGCTYFSIAQSTDPDWVPFFTDTHGGVPFYNKSWSYLSNQKP